MVADVPKHCFTDEYRARMRRQDRIFGTCLLAYLLMGVFAFSLYFSRNYCSGISSEAWVFDVTLPAVGAGIAWPLYISAQTMDAARGVEVPVQECLQPIERAP